MIKSEVIEIGAKAVSKDEPMVILFDETALSSLTRSFCDPTL